MMSCGREPDACNDLQMLKLVHRLSFVANGARPFWYGLQLKTTRWRRHAHMEYKPGLSTRQERQYRT